MINDEMQPWAQVTGSVCRWKNTKAAGRMNLLTSRREETGVQFVCERRRNLACADVYPLLILISYGISPFTHFFPLSPVSNSSFSISFLIPHSTLPACPLSSFPDLIIYFCFSHIHLSPPPFLAVSQDSVAAASPCCRISRPSPSRHSSSLSAIWPRCLMSPASAVSHR